MQSYTIQGVNKHSSADVVLIIEAESEDNARVKAELQDIVVTKITEGSTILDKPNVKDDAKYIFYAFILCGMIAIVCIYFSGWRFHGANDQMPWKYNRSGGSVINSKYIVFRFNSDYYGVYITDRYFDSPTLSWILLGVGVGAFVGSIQHLFKIMR